MTGDAVAMGGVLAFFGFIGVGLLSLWELVSMWGVFGPPSRVLFAAAGFVLLVGVFAAVEGGR